MQRHGGAEGTGALHQEGHHLVLYRRRVAGQVQEQCSGVLKALLAAGLAHKSYWQSIEVYHDTITSFAPILPLPTHLDGQLSEVLQGVEVVSCRRRGSRR